MSGPYCRTCKFFSPAIWQGDDPESTEGECMDPTKIIYYERSGNPKNEPPAVVAEWNSCRNHTSENVEDTREAGQTQKTKE